jgi:hypothetical protein
VAASSGPSLDGALELPPPTAAATLLSLGPVLGREPTAAAIELSLGPAWEGVAIELVLDESPPMARTSTTAAVAIRVSRAASHAALWAWTWDLIE